VRAQRADAADLDFEWVAGLHPGRRGAAVADAFRRAGAITSLAVSAVKSEQKATISRTEDQETAARRVTIEAYQIF
jgi:hypothetical protein